MANPADEAGISWRNSEQKFLKIASLRKKIALWNLIFYLK